MDAVPGCAGAAPGRVPENACHWRFSLRWRGAVCAGGRGGAPMGWPNRFFGAPFPFCETGGAASDAGGATAENDAEDDIVAGRADL